MKISLKRILFLTLLLLLFVAAITAKQQQNQTVTVQFGIQIGTPGPLTLSSPSMAFGNQPQNTTSSPITVTATNGGPGSVQFRSTLAVNISGTNAADFASTSSTTCTNSLVLTVNQTCNLVVTFTPSTTNAENAILTLTSTASNNPVTVPLTGTGTVVSGGNCSTGTVLSQTACSMTAGTWVAMSTNGFNSGNVLRPVPDGGSGLEFSNRAAVWNPVNNTLMVLDGAHAGTGTTCGSTNFASYTESTNTWAVNLPNPCPNFDNATGIGSTNLVHPYDHQTIDSNGNFYHRQYTSGKVMVFSQSSQTWSQCTPYNTNGDSTNTWNNFGSFNAAGSLVYFPDRNSLLMLDGEWGLWELPLSSGNCTGLWTLLASTIGGGFSPQLTNIQDHHNIGGYSPLCHCVVFDFFWRYNSDGTLTQLTGAPFYIGIAQSPGSAIGSVVTTDPVGGHFLVWNGNTSGTPGYDYNPLTDTWTATGIAPPSGLWPAPEGGVTNTNVIPIPKYGVMMAVMVGSASGSAVYLYKHTTMTSGLMNGFNNRVAGINTPGGSASIVSNQPFESALPTCSAPFPCDTWASGAQLTVHHYSAATPSLDTSVFADGASSVKFTVNNPSFQGDAGWVDYNFCKPSNTNTCLYGAGQEVYIQYKIRLDPAILGTFSGAGGLKHDITTEGDSTTVQAQDCSNSPAEVVTLQDLAAFSGPWMYLNCGYSAGTDFFTSVGYDPLQLGGAPSSNFLDQDAAGCPHYLNQGINVSDPSCFIYVGNEWFTIQKHIKVGAFGSTNSLVEQWMAHSNKPAQLVSNASDADIVNDGSGGATGKYGKIQISTYNTGANWNVSTAAWFDDIIVSTRRIPDPETLTPNAPDSLSLTRATGHITVSWRVNSQNGSAEDDAGFLVERCSNIAAQCFPNSGGSGFTQIATTKTGASSYQDNTTVSGTTYTYRVRAKNIYGNSAYTAAICFNGGTTCGGTAVAQ